MGVLNFSGPLHPRTNAVDFDILAITADVNVQQELNEIALQNINISTSRPTKRKRTKSNGKSSYDFRDFGIDARRRGSKHQRRKQNLCDLLQLNSETEECTFDDDWSNDDHMTLFTNLFLDEKKMKAWEDFVRLPEDKQKEFLEKKIMKESAVSNMENVDVVRGDEIADNKKDRFECLDKKLQDMLRSKTLAHMGLLEYYEDDVLCCTTESFPSVIVFNLDSSYDRMLIYALCQYMGLASNTIKLKNSSIIEIDVPCEDWRPPAMKLTDFLKKNRRCNN